MKRVVTLSLFAVVAYLATIDANKDDVLLGGVLASIGWLLASLLKPRPQQLMFAKESIPHILKLMQREELKDTADLVSRAMSMYYTIAMLGDDGYSRILCINDSGEAAELCLN